MADLPPLYPADPGSPFTTLAAPYTTGDTTVTLVDASTRPAAPNLLCLEGAGGSCVLLYTGIKGNTLTGVSQIEGPTGTWPAGSYAYRGFAAYDHNALIEHLNALEGMDPLPVGVQGDLLYHNGTAWVVLNAGTDGQVLQTRGAGANPAWADPVAPLPAGTFGDILFHDGTAWVARSTFGISQIAIDADKDWGGKNITNVGTLSANSLILPESPFTIAPDLTKNAKYLMKSDDAETIGTRTGEWTLMKSLPPLPASVIGTENSVYVSYQHKTSNPHITYTQIYVNGVAVGTERRHNSTSYTTWDEVITGLKAGDIIQIYARGNYAENTYPYVRNLRVYGVTFPTIPITPGIW